jgi:hypothetical protein
MMTEAVEDGRLSAAAVDNLDFSVGRNLLLWIEAYGMAAGNQRSCWLGKKKRLVCMTWRDAEESEEEEEQDDDDDDGY